MATSKRKRTQESSPTLTTKRRHPQRQAAAAAAARRLARRRAASDDSDFASDSSVSDQQYNTGSSESDSDAEEGENHDDSESEQDTNTKTKGAKRSYQSDKKEQQDDQGNKKARQKETENSDQDGENSTGDTLVTPQDFKPPVITVPQPKNSPFADAISPSSMIFMASLMVNNDRTFMKLHEDRWKTTRKDFMDFVDLLAKELHALDNTILVQPAKDAIYRQHRDLRFTSDRIPYKCTLKASFTREGKKSPLPGYHISLKPGNESRIAVGIFQPDTVLKQRMRSGIIRQGDLLREALSTDTVKEVFGSHDVGVALLNDQDRLKVAPKGIDKTHPEIELLRFNSLFVTKRMDDLDVVSEGFLDKILDVFEALLPFITVLNAWIA